MPQVTKLDPQIKKDFAREQIEFLKAQGVTNKIRLSRIFKASGPGQVKEAWKLATCQDWYGAIGEARKNLLACILFHNSPVTELSYSDVQDVLHIAGFYVPAATNAIAFQRILQGALEILFPDSHAFSKEDLDEIYTKAQTKSKPIKDMPETENEIDDMFDFDED